MREFSTPLSTVIPTTGNLTDDVVANAREAGETAVFSRPTPQGWVDVTAAQFHDEVRAVAKGLVAGEARSYYLTAGGTSPTFQSDLDESLGLGDLLSSLVEGDGLVFTAWPPGSGPRAIDQDGDCLSDGLDLQPQHDNFADPNFDGQVNLTDFARVQDCFTGEGIAAGTGCQLVDSDCDGDVDLTNYAAFHAELAE